MNWCLACKFANVMSATFCGRCGQSLTSGGLQNSSPSSTGLLVIESESFRLEIRTWLEAKAALKELRIHKKELGLRRKEILQSERQIRSEYSHEVRMRGSKFAGGGSIGRFIRLAQTSSRDAKRRELASMLAPLEQQKRFIDEQIISADRAVIQLQDYIDSNKP